MNINALLAFRAIVREGSAVAAAKRLSRSQPAVSRLISLLEHELKLSLFHRTRQRLVLTEEGIEFYRQVERILGGLHEIPQIAADIRSRSWKDLRLVAMPRTIAAWVAPATAAFRKRFPEVRISVDVLRRHDMENWLVGRHYDFGIGVLPAHHTAIDAVEIFRAPVGAVMKKNHPLARRTAIDVHALGDYALIGISAGLLPREQIDQMFRASAVIPRYAIETSATYLASALAAQGAGVAIMDTVSAAATQGSTVCVPLKPRESVSFGLLRPKQSRANPAADAYVYELNAAAEALTKTHQVQLAAG